MNATPLLTPIGAAHRLGLRRSQLAHLVDEDAIPFIRLPGGELRFDPIDLELFIEFHKARGGAEETSPVLPALEGIKR